MTKSGFVPANPCCTCCRVQACPCAGRTTNQDARGCATAWVRPSSIPRQTPPCALIQGSTGDIVVVLHMLGNHGPAYYKRYPTAFRRFQPTCDTGELRRCDRQSIVNAYDNAVLYTDHVLSQAVAYLKTQQERFDTAMIYVSDHGESLGEKGLFLHGLPQAIAPNEQTRVPMVWWLSESFKASRGLDTACLNGKTALALSHDNLFHSVLGLMAITTQVYDARLDIASACTHSPGSTPTR